MCKHCSGLGHHWGSCNVAESVPAYSAHRSFNLWPCCLQWIQICWVGFPCFSHVLIMTLLKFHSYVIAIFINLPLHTQNFIVLFVSFFYFRMIFTVLCGLLFGSDGYFVAFAWCSCALMFFIVSIGRDLEVHIWWF